MRHVAKKYIALGTASLAMLAFDPAYSFDTKGPLPFQGGGFQGRAAVSVPEPATFGLMLMGLGLTSFGLVRRRREH